MKQRTVKIAYIISHGVLSLALILMVLYLIVRHLIPTNHTQGTPLSGYLVPTLLHLVLSFVGMIPALYLPATSRNDIERKLMPPMYITMTLMDIQVLLHLEIIGIFGYLGPTAIAKIHLFSLLFSSLMLLFIGMFHLGINTSRIFRYSLLAALGCVLFTLFVPLQVAVYPLERSLWVTDGKFLLVPILLGGIAIFNYVALLSRERTQYTVFRSASLMAITLGNLLYIDPHTTWLGILLFAIGIAMGIPKERFSQI
jgi:hypothetical protein